MNRWRPVLSVLGVMLISACTAQPEATAIPTQPATIETEPSVVPTDAQLTEEATDITFAETGQPTPTASEATGTPSTDVNTVEGHAVITEVLPFSEDQLAQLEAPEGFAINVFAQGLGNIRMMAVDEEGTVYITRRDEGDVVALMDADADGQADGAPVTVISGQPQLHGITIHENRLYVATDTSVLWAELTGSGSIGEVQTLIDDLPTGGQHPNRTLLFGPDGMLYVTVGSTCNACDEPDPENATILQVQPDNGARRVFTEGLRNTIGFGWHPLTGAMWGMDHGSDWRGDEQPPEELNLLQEGANYGWPFCFGDRQVDNYLPAEPKGTTKEAFCQTTTAPTLTYTAHSAPIWMLFYTGGMFPEEYRNDVFVAMRGSWNRQPPTGYKVVRIDFDEAGQPTGFEDFVTGWLLEDQLANFGRIAGLAMLSDGSLLVSEDQNGVIYRISYGE